MGSSKTFDKGLSAAGQKMASKKAEEFRQQHFLPEIVYCSELPRTQQTANSIIQHLGLKTPPVILSELNERSFGIYEGQPYQQVFDAFDREGENPKTMETVSDFIARVLRGYEKIKNKTKDRALIVTHSNPLAVLRCYLYYPEDITHYWEHETDSYVSGFEVQL